MANRRSVRSAAIVPRGAPPGCEADDDDDDDDDPFTFRPPPATPAATAAAAAASSSVRSQCNAAAALGTAPRTARASAAASSAAKTALCPGTSLPGCGGGYRGDDLQLLGGCDDDADDDDAAAEAAAEANAAAAAEFQRIRAEVNALLVMPLADAGGAAGQSGRRALKALYTICCQPDAVAGAEQQLVEHGDALAVALAAVARVAFLCGPRHTRGYDKELLSLALSTCSALCRCTAVSQRIGAAALAAVLASCVGALLPAADADGAAPLLDQPMLAALNKVAVEAAAGCRRSAAVAALVQLLAGERGAQSAAA
jgi:hypothetical protein